MGFVLVQGWGDVKDDAAPRRAVDALTEVVEEACAATAATLLDTDVARDGYRHFLTAGAPTAVEDAERRLLQALTSTVQASGTFSVRAGLTSGRVFAGPIGAPERRTYFVMGDTTNLAARLTAMAGQPEHRCGVDGKFVVVASEVLDQRVAADHHPRRPVGLESAHGPGPGLQPAVVAFDAVVLVPTGVAPAI